MNVSQSQLRRKETTQKATFESEGYLLIIHILDFPV
jgi:hypothetical protein